MNGQLTIRPKANKDIVKKLQRGLKNGNINYEGSMSKTTIVSTKHKHILNNWINSYGGNAPTKRHLTTLLEAGSGASGSNANYSIGVIGDGSWFTAFLVEFSSKNDQGERTYHESSISMSFSSNATASIKNLVRDNPVDLAILVISGGSKTLQLTW